MLLNSPQSVTIHQYHHSVSMADAITKHLFFIQDSLKLSGVQGEIFATEIPKKLHGKVKRFKVSDVWNADLFLIHHSHGNPVLNDVLKVEIPKAFEFHNITPDHFFRHDPMIRKLCKIGREQISRFDSCLAKFAASSYNKRELEELGMSDVRVMPQVDLKISSRERVAIPRGDKLNILFVGKLTPHKNQALTIRVVSYLKDRFRLILVGREDPVYSRYLRLLVKELGLTDTVLFKGELSDKELHETYLSSQIFLCVSLHEGFCVPLVEAMAHDLPVFYLPKAAVTETMGGAGVMLQSSDPKKIAQAILNKIDEPNGVEAVLGRQRIVFQNVSKFQTKENASRLLLNTVLEIRNEPRVFT